MKQADRKAWRYFRKLLGDDEKFFALKTKNEPIELNGSEGGRYFLYPDGQLARLDKRNPYVGKLMPDGNMPIADYFSALYIWITQRETEFREKWGCGSVSLYYNKGELTTERGDRVAGVHEGYGFDGTICVLGAMTGMVSGESAYLIPDKIYQVLMDDVDKPATPLGAFPVETEGGEDTNGES